jgi:hypothetical protein
MGLRSEFRVYCAEKGGADENIGVGSIMLLLGGCLHRWINLPMRMGVWRSFDLCRFQLHICKFSSLSLQDLN